MARRGGAAIRVGQPVRIGVTRDADSPRPWQVRAYKETPSYPRGYVQYKEPETGAWRVARPRAAETLDECFDRVEAAISGAVTMSATSAAGQRRTMGELGKRYIQWLVDQGKSEGYINGRENIVDLWVRRFQLADGTKLGDVLVSDWTPELTRQVIDKARTKVSAARVEDIGVCLSGMRKTAWRKTAGVRWLARTEDPMEGVSYAKSAAHPTVANASASYVETRYRPTTAMVSEVMRVAASALDGSHSGADEWMELLLGVAAFCGLRQAEQLALRADDVDLNRRMLDINGRWYNPRKGRVSYRKALTKTSEIRTVPYPASLHPLMVERVEKARADAEVRRAAAVKAKRPAAEVALVSVAWLFPHKVHGIPLSKERINDDWHTVREAATAPEWPRHILYRHFRHHYATWLKANLPNATWEDVAFYMGDDPETVKAHYVLPGADLHDRTRAAFDAL